MISLVINRPCYPGVYLIVKGIKAKKKGKEKIRLNIFIQLAYTICRKSKEFIESERNTIMELAKIISVNRFIANACLLVRT